MEMFKSKPRSRRRSVNRKARAQREIITLHQQVSSSVSESKDARGQREIITLDPQVSSPVSESAGALVSEEHHARPAGLVGR
jgi:hypothetical protein